MKPRSVLVVKPSSLGDIVHTLPAVHALKAAWPDTRITWLVNTEWAPLLAGNPDVARVIEFPRKEFRGISGLMKIPAWLRSVREESAPELSLDFQGLARSALLAKGLRSKRIHGMSDAREMAGLLYHRAVRVDTQQHSVERYLQLVADLEILIERPLRFPLPAGKQPIGFAQSERFLLVHPFSRGAGKSLPMAALEQLCTEMAPRKIVLVGRSDETWPERRHVTNLLNQTSLAELIWLIRHAAFTVSVDSGPMHIAAALTDRLLGLHTWSDPRLVGPYNPATWVWKGGAIFEVSATATAPLEMETPLTTEAVPPLVDFLRARLNENSRPR